jgi:hypothetical protein
VVGVNGDVASAHDGDHVATGEAVAIFDDRRDAKRGRRFDDEASVVEEHSHAGDDQRRPDQRGVVSHYEQVLEDSRDWMAADDPISDGIG